MNKLLNKIILVPSLLSINTNNRLTTSVLLIQHQQQQLLKRKNIIMSTKMNTSTNTNNTSTKDSNKYFIGKQDRYNGIIIDSAIESCNNVKEFNIKLTESLNEWILNNKRCIWFKVNILDSEWIPILTQNGFKFHHAKQTYLMLYKWLPTEESSNIPPYAHTMLGVGALVVQEHQQQLLAVQEKYFIGQEPMWKLPGGYVEPGEDLIDAAIREVYEETNIECEFKSLISLRHTHHVMFECSDLYVVLLLHPKNSKNLSSSEEQEQTINKCKRELLDCKWMDINEFLTLNNVTDLNKSFIKQYLKLKHNNVIINQTHHIHSILNKPYSLYNIQFNK